MLVFVGFVFVSFGQTTPTEVTTDAIINNAYYKYIWGTTSDTLTNADTLNFVFRVKTRSDGKVKNFTIKLYSDFVSGTAGGTLVGYNSIDGVIYQANGDTITVSSLTADAMDAEVISLSDYLYPYYKLIYLQSGTAVTIPKVYVYSKKN